MTFRSSTARGLLTKQRISCQGSPTLDRKKKHTDNEILVCGVSEDQFSAGIEDLEQILQEVLRYLEGIPRKEEDKRIPQKIRRMAKHFGFGNGRLFRRVNSRLSLVFPKGRLVFPMSRKVEAVKTSVQYLGIAREALYKEACRRHRIVVDTVDIQ